MKYRQACKIWKLYWTAFGDGARARCRWRLSTQRRVLKIFRRDQRRLRRNKPLC